MSTVPQEGPIGRVLGIALALAMLAGAPTGGEAQSNLSAELRGGLAIPAGDLDEIGETGGGFGVGLGYRIHPRASLRLDGELEVLSEDLAGRVVMPRTFLYHYHAGLELAVTDPAATPWLVRVRGGAGGTTYDTQRFFEDGDDFFDVYFSVNGGLSVGRRFRESMELGVLGQAFIVFAEKDRTAELAGLSPAVLNPFREASSFPVGVYLRWVP